MKCRASLEFGSESESKPQSYLYFRMSSSIFLVLVMNKIFLVSMNKKQKSLFTPLMTYKAKTGQAKITKGSFLSYNGTISILHKI